MLPFGIVSLSLSASVDQNEVAALCFERTLSGESRDQHESHSSSKLCSFDVMVCIRGSVSFGNRARTKISGQLKREMWSHSLKKKNRCTHTHKHHPPGSVAFMVSDPEVQRYVLNPSCTHWLYLSYIKLCYQIHVSFHCPVSSLWNSIRCTLRKKTFLFRCRTRKLAVTKPITLLCYPLVLQHNE